MLVLKALDRHDYEEAGALTASAPRIDAVVQDPTYFARLAGIRSAVFVFAVLVGYSLRRIDTAASALVLRLELLSTMSKSEAAVISQAAAGQMPSWLPQLEDLASASESALASGKAMVATFERFADRMGVSSDDLTSWWPPLKDDLEMITTIAEGIEADPSVSEFVLEIMLFQAGEARPGRKSPD